MSNLNSRAESAREGARRSDGKFGSYTLDEATQVQLTGLSSGGESAPASEVDAMSKGATTPFGTATSVSHRLPGTATCKVGGRETVRLSAELNAAIPEEYRNANGWYDSNAQSKDEMHAVTAHYPRALCSKGVSSADVETVRQDAVRALAQSDWRRYEKAYGVELDRDEHAVKDRELWEADNPHGYRVIWGADAAENNTRGSVIVRGYRGGDNNLSSREFVVPVEHLNDQGNAVSFGGHQAGVAIDEREVQGSEGASKIRQRLGLIRRPRMSVKTYG